MTMTKGVGTPFYMAPELSTNMRHCTGAVDVFSFGIMTAQVMVGKLVYDAEFDNEYGLFSSHHELFCCFWCCVSLFFHKLK